MKDFERKLKIKARGVAFIIRESRYGLVNKLAWGYFNLQIKHESCPTLSK